MQIQIKPVTGDRIPRERGQVGQDSIQVKATLRDQVQAEKQAQATTNHDSGQAESLHAVLLVP